MIFLPRSPVPERVKHALLIKEDDLRYLQSYLARTFDDGIAYHARCLDGTELRFEDIEDLISYENPKFRRVVEIAMECRHGDKLSLDLQVGVTYSFFLDLPFRRESAIYTIYSDDDGELMKIRSELSRRFESMRPWYSILTLVNSIFILLVPLFLYALLARTYSIIMKLFFAPPESVSTIQGYTFGDVFAPAILFGAILLSLGMVVDRIREFFFPRVFIVIGRQKDEWQKRGKVLNVVVVIIGIGLVVSVAGTLIAQGIGWAS